MEEQTYHIFIGYDEREQIPFQVTKHSILKHATVPVKIHKLAHRDLRSRGLFTREWKVSSNGQYTDLSDGSPFSTQFSHSRFLTPELWRQLDDPSKSPLVMFVDCDFVFQSDIKDLFRLIEEKASAPVHCVKHNYVPKATIKMDGSIQMKYNMKLWSACMVFDMRHKELEAVTKDYVNTTRGLEMHNFKFLSDPSIIGSLPESWHFIPDHSESNTGSIDAIHFTEGGPWFLNYKKCRHGNLWDKAYEDYLASLVCSVNIEMNPDRLLEI